MALGLDLTRWPGAKTGVEQLGLGLKLGLNLGLGPKLGLNLGVNMCLGLKLGRKMAWG